MKVYKVADIVSGEVTYFDQRKFRVGEVTAVLTNLKPAQEPRPDSMWKLELAIGEQVVHLALPPLISISDSLDSPLFLGDYRLVFFRDRLFMPERSPKSAEEREEIVLRVKKAVYDEEADLASLKAAVANLEAAIEYSKSGPRRNPIPEDIKLLAAIPGERFSTVHIFSTK